MPVVHGTIAGQDETGFERRSEAKSKERAAGSKGQSGVRLGGLVVMKPVERFDPEG
jgi:hypothetical protein